MQLSHKVRAVLAALVAVCLIGGSAAAPAAHAAKKKKVTTTALDKRLKKTDKRVATARKSLSKLSTDLGGLSKRLTTTEGSLKTLTDAAPQLVTGLTTLAGVVQNQIAPGLLQLKDALEKQVSPALTALGTAVQTTIPTAIKDVATSQEYGITNVLIGGAQFAPLGTTSSDIPDDANSATASGELPIVVGDGTNGTVPAGASVALRSAIRSGESDGKTTTGDPAGYVGGLLIMKCAGSLNPANAGCDPDGAGALPEVSAGTIVCRVGPSSTTAIPLPNGTTLNAFVQKIQLASGRTDQSKPSVATDGATVNPLQGASASSAAGNGVLSNAAAFGCSNGSRALDQYTLTVQTQFLDPPTSTSPGATD